MFNDIKIGPVTFHMYGLMIAIGFAAALMMCLKRGKKTWLERGYYLWNLLLRNLRWNDRLQAALLYCRDPGDFKRSVHTLEL